MQESEVQTRWLEGQIEETQRKIDALEPEYAAAKAEIESGKVEEKRKAVADELFSRVLEYDHQKAGALDANYILWWGRERIEELGRPHAIVAKYEELCLLAHEWYEQLKLAEGPAEKGL